jgi:hypothetical protein
MAKSVDNLPPEWREDFDLVEDAIRRILREELRNLQLIATCYTASEGVAAVPNPVAAETVQCVHARCPLCKNAEDVDLTITAYNTPPLYFIQAESNLWIKIGYGTPEKRITQMRIGSPAPLRLVGMTHAGGPSLEPYLHNHFHETRQHGEWFTLTRPLFHAIHQVRRHWAALNWALPPVLVPSEWLSE